MNARAPFPGRINAPERLAPLDRAARHIDTHLFKALTLQQIADVACLSPYHFSRQFAARFGQNVMAYVRVRRLHIAARVLASDDDRALVEIAYDCGFDSQEGFTRAFKRAFGTSPGRFRKTGTLDPSEITMTAITTITPDLFMEPAPVKKPGLRLVGVAGTFTETNKFMIPALWDKLVPRLPLPGQASFATFGVFWGDPGDGCDMGYMAAVEVGEGFEAPEGLELKVIEPASYAVFRQTLDAGDLHQQMQAATKQIWGEKLPSSGFTLARAPDIEYYPPDFEPGVAGKTVEFWAPVAA